MTKPLAETHAEREAQVTEGWNQLDQFEQGQIDAMTTIGLMLDLAVEQDKFADVTASQALASLSQFIADEVASRLGLSLTD